jgi:hypothetical protein
MAKLQSNTTVYGNLVVQATINAAAIDITGQTNTATFFATTSANVGGNNQINTTAYVITGNSTTAPTLTISSNSTVGVVYGNNSITGAPSVSLQNSISIATITSLTTTLGNSTVTSAPLVRLQNSTTQANLTSASLIIGSTTANTLGVFTPLVTANMTGTYANLSGQVNAATLYLQTSANVGGNVQLTTSTLTLTGNSTTVPTINVTTSSSTSGLLGGNSSITGTPTISLQNSVSIATRTSLSTTLGNSTVTTAPSVLLQNSTSQANLNSAQLSINTISATTNGATIAAASFNVGNTTVNTQIIPNSLVLRANSTAQTTITGTTFSSNTGTVSGMWTNLPGALIMNWGIVVANSIGSNTITFGNAYVTNAYSVICTPISNSTSFVIAHANNITKTGFTIQCGNTSALNNTGISGVYYFAIGA